MHAALLSLIVFAGSVASAPLTTHSVRSAVHIADEVTRQSKRDSLTVSIEPAKRVEVKLVMKKGEKADFEWTSTDDVGYNLHGEVPTDPSVKAHIYSRGSSRAEKGRIEAVFDGVHGWSWRNNTDRPVTVTVKAVGQFSALKKM